MSVRTDTRFRPPAYFAVLHLTANSGLLVNGCSGGCTPYDARAIQISGSVLVKAGYYGEATTAWDVHFRQYFQLRTEAGFYAGRAQDGGSMSVNFNASPPLPKGFCPDYLADRASGRMVEFNDTYRWLPGGGGRELREQFDGASPAGRLWRADITMTDHPFSELPMTLPNYKTGQDNYLYSVAREFEVITALVAFERLAGTVTPLGYLRWGARHQVAFRWAVRGTSPDPVPRPPQVLPERLTVSDPAPGVPQDDGGLVAGLIRNPAGSPGGDSYNDLARDAYLAVVHSRADTTYTQARDGWSPDVPKDLFT